MSSWNLVGILYMTEHMKFRRDKSTTDMLFGENSMYAIVKFVDECDAPGIVCTNWINSGESSCLYPNVRTNEARDRLLKKYAQPALDWISCRIKILHKYNNFSEALLHLSKAEETSNLESEEETINRRRKKIRRHNPEEGSSDEDTTQKSKASRTCFMDIDPYPIPNYELQPETSAYIIPQSDIQILDNSMQENPEASASAHSYLEKSPACSSSQTLMNGKFVAWMADISHKVQRLDDKMDLILKNQAELLHQQNRQVTETLERDDDYEVLGSLPATDNSSFEEINLKIAEDSHLRHLLVKVLISVGGKDLRCHIHNMLRKMLNDDVAELYSLSGKSTLKDKIKKPFLATEVSKAIFSACQRIHKDGATDIKIKEAIGDWLNQAKVRKLRRMQRHEKNTYNPRTYN